MKRSVIIVMLVLFIASIAVPAFAQENKRAENNKNIAEFISDTAKLPFILLGILARKDVEQVKKDLDYKDNQGLIKCLRKKGE